MTARIWKVRGREEKFTDEELVDMIRQGLLRGNDYIATNDMKVWLKIEDSIYQFYLKEKAYETI